MNMEPLEIDTWHMEQALRLAERGRGLVEPNPMVGCVVVQGCEIIGEGFHRRFGEAHAEVEALSVAGSRANGATLVVTLEPCCHYGKTPPCTEAILNAGIKRVVVAMRDPFPQVAGGGITLLETAGVEVTVGVCETQARKLNAPYLKRLQTGRPWVIAKWAMTLDGRIATHTGSSRWISGEESRKIVHQLRSRVDAIMVGRETARADDPMLTARLPNGEVPLRKATRIVVDTRGLLTSQSHLVKTAKEIPVLVAVGTNIYSKDAKRLEKAGCELFYCKNETHAGRLSELLDELGRREMTNILVEGGGKLLGGLLDTRQIDEVYTFIAPKLVGGETAPNPIGGEGISLMENALRLDDSHWHTVGSDICLSGRILYPQK